VPLYLEIDSQVSVASLRDIILSHRFVKGAFGLKISGKRKRIVLNDTFKLLQDVGAESGSVFTVEALENKPDDDEEAEAEFDDSFGVITTSTSQSVSNDVASVSKKRIRMDYSEQYKTRKVRPHDSAPKVITGSFIDSSEIVDIPSLLRCFLSPDKVTSEDKIGEMTFNMFTSAARYAALERGRSDVAISYIDKSPPCLLVAFKSNKKSYQDSCRFYPEETILALMKEVYLSTVTRSRRGTESCRRMFAPKELCSRAPHILWSVAFSKCFVL
jgi:hypothetical protein